MQRMFDAVLNVRVIRCVSFGDVREKVVRIRFEIRGVRKDRELTLLHVRKHITKTHA